MVVSPPFATDCGKASGQVGQPVAHLTFFTPWKLSPGGKKAKRPLGGHSTSMHFGRHFIIISTTTYQGCQIKLQVFVWYFSFNTQARVANQSEPNKSRSFV
jgi:hypothetical protein